MPLNPPITDFSGYDKQGLIDLDAQLVQEMADLDPQDPNFYRDISILSGQRQSVARLLWHWDRDHPEG